MQREQHFPLGPALGQCCGGAVTLRYAPLAEARPAAWDAPTPRFTLQLHGAGHVGRAIVALLDGIACNVQWIDERDDAFPPGLSAPHVERVCVDAVEAEVACAPPGAFYLVLTHRHDADFAITEAILRRGDFGFLGLIGSQTKRNRFRHRYERWASRRRRSTAHDVPDRPAGDRRQGARGHRGRGRRPAARAVVRSGGRRRRARSESTAAIA